MHGFSIGGRSAATAATANHVGAALWNPATARSLWVTQIGWSKTVATADQVGIVRISARGTAGSSITSGIQSDAEGAVAPRSGAILDLAAYSVQPTLVSATVYQFRWSLPASIGSGFLLPLPDVWEVPAGQGLALLTPPATVLQPADVSFFWRE